MSRHHLSVLLLLEPSLWRACALDSSRRRRAAAADAAGDNSMLVCARSRADSSSTCATWTWLHCGCRYSLAQWPSLPQLWQVSSHASFWLPAAPLWAPPWGLPSPCPRTLAWAPPRTMCGLPRLQPPVEGEDSPFFPSPWQASHCSRVRCNFPSTMIGLKRSCGSSPSMTLRRPIASSIDIVERSGRDSIERAIYLYFSGMQQKSFSTALSSS
jgi:hypothetical protein